MRHRRSGSANPTPKMFIENLEPRTLLAAVKIMPLGDSITENFSGHASYRFFLYNQLIQAGYDVDFVGSLTGVNGGSPLYNNFDQNHEGHSGITTDGVRDNIVNWANLNKPDIVLLQIGANDIDYGQSLASTITELGQLVTNLRSVVPNVKIGLAQITPEVSNQSTFATFNSMVATFASQNTTTASPITLVDLFTGFNPSVDTFDGVHPSDSGERKMSARWFSALQSMLPAPTPPNVVYLSDLNATASTNGWGPIEKDRSNNETGATDGHTLSLNKNGYLKGLGVHAAADTTYNISGGAYSSFNTDIGVDDEVGNSGGIVFQVYVDGSLKFTSSKMTGASATQSISIPLAANSSTLRLVVTDGGDGADYDHGDWANARLIVGAPITPPASPSGLGATFNSGANRIDLSWTDNASDEVGFRIERKAGAGGNYAQIADIASPNLNSYSDVSALAIGTTYYYRVLAYKSGAASTYSNESSATIVAPLGTTYLSDMTFGTQVNGWGVAEKDRSNGEQGSADGRTITLNGTTYTKGIGVHAASDITFNIAGAGFTQFVSDIGLDDEVGNNGSVFFQVYIGSTLAYSSPKMTGASATIPVSLAIASDATTLRLVVTDGGDGNTFDHGDWASARLIAGTPVPAPTAPSDLTAAFNTTSNKVDLHWTDAAADNNGFRIERKAGVSGTWSQIADVSASTFNFSDGPGLSVGVAYYYRVYAYKTGAPNSSSSNEASATVTAAPGTTYLSDLAFTTTSNGWGAVEKDRSNGEQGASDGRVITLNGTTYTKGLGAHANSDLTFNLNGQYSTFFSDIGIDDEVSAGSVIFEVWADGTRIFQSTKLTGSTATQTINGLSVAGVQKLRLVITDAGDGNTFDHGDWAGARLVN